MELRGGMIHGELALKTYILYILQQFEEPVSLETLTELAYDRLTDYFAYTAALGDLRDTGLVAETNNRYFSITEQGRSALSGAESSLPASTRRHTRREIAAFLQKRQRDEAISAETVERDGALYTSLSLAADHGPLLSLELQVGSRERAVMIEKNFRAHAEQVYLQLVERLSAEQE